MRNTSKLVHKSTLQSLAPCQNRRNGSCCYYYHSGLSCPNRVGPRYSAVTRVWEARLDQAHQAHAHGTLVLCMPGFAGSSAPRPALSSLRALASGTKGSFTSNSLPAPAEGTPSPQVLLRKPLQDVGISWVSFFPVPLGAKRKAALNPAERCEWLTRNNLLSPPTS